MTVVTRNARRILCPGGGGPAPGRAQRSWRRDRPSGRPGTGLTVRASTRRPVAMRLSPVSPPPTSPATERVRRSRRAVRSSCASQPSARTAHRYLPRERVRARLVMAWNHRCHGEGRSHP
jgi:hypothetical protein